MRKIIAALQVSLDGFIEGPNEELDWVDSWEDPYDVIGNVDAFILGARMYPGYEQVPGKPVLDNPKGILPFTGRPATAGEIEYAQFASRTPHVVVSSKLQTSSWKNTRIVRDLEEVRRLKEAQGMAMHAVGGATLVSSLVNAGLVDENPTRRATNHPGRRQTPVQGREGTPRADVRRCEAAESRCGHVELCRASRTPPLTVARKPKQRATSGRV